ncbi:MAG: hypothetical protein ACI87W_001635 [Halieaceae bacterium]|jgi:hypothetical protein
MRLHRAWPGAALMCAAWGIFCAGPATGQALALPEGLAENWYRVEVLIFMRDDEATLASEEWNPTPTVTYPDRYRFLIDPALAEQRMLESGGFASAISTRGVQQLTVAAPAELLLDHLRPDALVQPAALVEDPNTVLASPAAIPAITGESDQAQSADELPAMAADDSIPALLALPYELLPADKLEFRAQARSLNRRGQPVLFHGAWWAILEGPESALPIAVDRSGDSDSASWPALQGSIKLYLTRYLHLEVDLWLNTLGAYLPAGWKMPAPPQARASVFAQTLGARLIDPWAPDDSAASEISTETELDQPATLLAIDGQAPLQGGYPPTAIIEGLQDVSTSDAPTPAVADGGQNNSPLQSRETEPPYPWVHAITHRQSRRMRSEELHYLDHPVIGVLVKVLPAAPERLPIVEPQVDAELYFRERHTLPAERLMQAADPDQS